MLSLTELFTSLTDLLHLRHPVLSQLRAYLAHKGISEEAVWALISYYLDVTTLLTTYVGADTCMPGTYTLLP